MNTSLYQLGQAAEQFTSRQWHHLALALVVAMLVHLVFFIRWQTSVPLDSAEDIGSDGIVVGIQRITQAAPPPTPKQRVQPVTPPPVVETVKPQVEVKDTNRGKLDQVVIPPTEMEPPKEVLPKEVPPQEVKEQPPEPIAPPPEEIPEPVAEIEEEPVEDTVEAEVTPQTTNSEAQPAPEMVVGGGNPAARIKYVRRLTAWLERHKRYPSKARRRREEGTVVLNFVINRSGELQSYKIVTASQYPALNDAVEKMIQRASPLPKPPADMQAGRSMVSFTVPVNFSLNRR